jgi:mannose-1-phosphate guanylyltransferase
MTDADLLKRFYAVLPAGGPGTRLWPLSRTDRPKFLLDVMGTGRSLIQQTWDRLSQLTGGERMLVVTGASHAAAVAEQLPALAPDNLLREPYSRDTAPAISLAAATIVRRDPDAIIGSFPADHLIQDLNELQRSVRDAVAAAEAGYIVTIGITPTGPSSAYGYVQAGGPVVFDESRRVLKAVQFVEKPDAATATSYLAQGNWLWNAGIFVTRADVLLAALKDKQPELHAVISRITDASDSEPSADAVTPAIWQGLGAISIDHALAEPLAPSGRIAVVPAALGWDDIGDWASVAELLAPEGNVGLAVLGDVARVLSADSTGLVVANSGRTIEVRDVDDVIVVDTPDVLLVISRERAQDVKLLVEDLRRRGRLDLL